MYKLTLEIAPSTCIVINPFPMLIWYLVVSAKLFARLAEKIYAKIGKFNKSIHKLKATVTLMDTLQSLSIMVEIHIQVTGTYIYILLSCLQLAGIAIQPTGQVAMTGQQEYIIQVYKIILLLGS